MTVTVRFPFTDLTCPSYHTLALEMRCYLCVLLPSSADWWGPWPGRRGVDLPPLSLTLFTVIPVQPNYYDFGRLLSITTRRRKQTLSKDHLSENIPTFQITSVITCHQPVPGTVWVTAIRATSNRTLWWQLNLRSSGSVVKQFYKSISAGSNTFQYQEILNGDRHGERWLKFKITLAGR